MSTPDKAVEQFQGWCLVVKLDKSGHALGVEATKPGEKPRTFKGGLGAAKTALREEDEGVQDTESRRTRLHRALDCVLDKRLAKDDAQSPEQEWEHSSSVRNGWLLELARQDLKFQWRHWKDLPVEVQKAVTAMLQKRSDVGKAHDSKPINQKQLQAAAVKANARHALFNAGKAVQQSNFRSAVVWFRKAEELFMEAGLTKEANLAAGKAMEAESYAGKKDVDRGGKDSYEGAQKERELTKKLEEAVATLQAARTHKAAPTEENRLWLAYKAAKIELEKVQEENLRQKKEAAKRRKSLGFL